MWWRSGSVCTVNTARFYEILLIEVCFYSCCYLNRREATRWRPFFSFHRRGTLCLCAALTMISLRNTCQDSDMMSWFPPLTHGIECNCISQAERVHRMGTQFVWNLHYTTRHYGVYRLVHAGKDVLRCFHIRISVRGAERLCFSFFLMRLWNKVNTSDGERQDGLTDRGTDGERKEVEGGDKSTLPTFWLSNWTTQSQHDEGVWKPIKN